jgi:hypothetical protein
VTTADSPSKATRLAYLQYLGGHFEDCRAACDRLLSEDSDDFDTLYLRGLALGRLGQETEAMVTLQRALQRFPYITRFDDISSGGKAGGDGVRWIKPWEHRYREHRRFTDTTAFVISYPKCGRTWLRTMLGHYLLNGRPGDPLEIFEICRADPSLPTIDFTSDDRPQHKYFSEVETDKSFYRDKVVVFLARDPRDVVVSNYFQFTKRGGRSRAKKDEFAGNLSDFVRYPRGGLPNVVAFYNAWARQLHVPSRFHSITYEALHRDTPGELKRLIDVLELPDHGKAALDTAIAFGSFENMRQIEETGALSNARLKSPDAKDPEAYKVRKGKVGGYRDYLGADDIAYIDDYLARELDEYFADYKQPSNLRDSAPV